MIKITELPEGDVSAAQSVVNLMLLCGAEKHPVLTELRRDVFRGGRTWVLWDQLRTPPRKEFGLDPGALGTPVSINCTRIGKRKKNVWEPFMNWWGAYTLPDERRRGHAYRLYTEVEGVALRAGCRRVRSLAGSSAGLGLHLSLRHQCWGLTDNDEVWVDSPLPGHEGLYTGLTPPQAPGQRMLVPVIKDIINRGLRYDHTT